MATARRYAIFGTVGALLLGAAVVAWLALRPDASAGPCVVVNGPATIREVNEASGLAISRRNPAVIWTHNDSGNDAVLFAIDGNGTLHGRTRVPIRTRDWEDVSFGPCPSGHCLYIADIGDNRNARQRVQIYRVPEPAVGDAETAAPEVFNATYADGPHNAEAMFVIGTALFIVTRDRTGGLYRAVIPETDSHDLRFELLGQLGIVPVTDAETSTDGKSVVVRTSHEAVLYRTVDLSRGIIAPILRVPLDGLKEMQGEGVALDGNMLYLASEARAWILGAKILTLRCTIVTSISSPVATARSCSTPRMGQTAAQGMASCY